MGIIKLKVFSSATALHALFLSLTQRTYPSESDLLVASLFKSILSGLIVQINDQPEYKDMHRQNHLQQSTFKSGSIEKTPFIIAVIFNLISI